ncbi:TetR/AcrR family transcriptional regulator [Planococcus sp. N028]|uniref:TetR/AcrR family transcriptional regulator n=1 Tax=Planococcus shixiaomingii TaxID=3058393 RepID=A0ABT8N6C1_9BACL|nr:MULTISPECIES: TetR/AcrR family transcriptional regulator [unclassified Planococcus (in: firmicutes)]MDN7243202.1 TetR/AcrR family transcriptional regulator [Planococcus sp. N028]WKA55145.1 TetR/AcrR family transcriptional regulator [Planococcus sp. N022]
MKEKITQQSVVLFEKKGFSETSIQDIVEALSVTKGTFYYYFASKEQLLMDIHLGYIDDLLTRQKQLASSALTNSEKMKSIVHLLIDDIKSHGASGRVFFREMRHLTVGNAEVIKKKREQFRVNIEELIARGMEQGEFRKDLSPALTAFAILGVTNWSYQWFNPSGEISAPQLAESYCDFILNGIV